MVTETDRKQSNSDVIEIQPLERKPDVVIQGLPGSKSITNRALMIAALAEGESVLEEALFSEDTHWFVDGLRRLGFEVAADEAARQFRVQGLGGRIPAQQADLFVGLSGTTARFMTAFVTLGSGRYTIDGVPRMRERPMKSLLDALNTLGADVASQAGNGCLPLIVQAAGMSGGNVVMDASKSSQLLSAVLLAAPYANDDVQIQVTKLVSAPYIGITTAMIQQFGVEVETSADMLAYTIRGRQRYRGRSYRIEPDASNASYFLAAAAITGGRVRVPDLGNRSLQGDARFAEVLGRMGCDVTIAGDYIEVIGPEMGLHGIEIDLNEMNDMTQTLAAIAPFADSPTTIRNVEFIRYQETDRIRAVANELRKLGQDVIEYPDGLTITPHLLRPAQIETYNDHRMAMAFAVAGLRQPGIRIANPGCTAKTFPDYFEKLEQLRG